MGNLARPAPDTPERCCCCCFLWASEEDEGLSSAALLPAVASPRSSPAPTPPFHFCSTPAHFLLVLQTSAQQALTGTINSSMQAVHAAQSNLDDFDTLPPLGQDAVSGRRGEEGSAASAGVGILGNSPG